jgi:hypothetical protein
MEHDRRESTHNHPGYPQELHTHHRSEKHHWGCQPVSSLLPCGDSDFHEEATTNEDHAVADLKLKSAYAKLVTPREETCRSNSDD